MLWIRWCKMVRTLKFWDHVRRSKRPRGHVLACAFEQWSIECQTVIMVRSAVADRRCRCFRRGFSAWLAFISGSAYAKAKLGLRFARARSHACRVAQAWGCFVQYFQCGFLARQLAESVRLSRMKVAFGYMRNHAWTEKGHTALVETEALYCELLELDVSTHATISSLFTKTFELEDGMAALKDNLLESEETLARTKQEASETLSRTKKEAKDTLDLAMKEATETLALSEKEASEVLACTKRDAKELLARTKEEASCELAKTKDEARHELSQTKQHASETLARTKASASAELARTQQELTAELDRAREEAKAELARTKSEASETLALARQEANDTLESSKRDWNDAQEKTKADASDALERAKRESSETIERIKTEASEAIEKTKTESNDIIERTKRESNETITQRKKQMDAMIDQMQAEAAASIKRAEAAAKADSERSQAAAAIDLARLKEDANDELSRTQAEAARSLSRSRAETSTAQQLARDLQKQAEEDRDSATAENKRLSEAWAHARSECMELDAKLTELEESTAKELANLRRKAEKVPPLEGDLGGLRDELLRADGTISEVNAAKSAVEREAGRLLQENAKLEQEAALAKEAAAVAKQKQYEEERTAQQALARALEAEGEASAANAARAKSDASAKAAAEAQARAEAHMAEAREAAKASAMAEAEARAALVRAAAEAEAAKASLAQKMGEATEDARPAPPTRLASSPPPTRAPPKLKSPRRASSVKDDPDRVFQHTRASKGWTQAEKRHQIDQELAASVAFKPSCGLTPAAGGSPFGAKAIFMQEPEMDAERFAWAHSERSRKRSGSYSSSKSLPPPGAAVSLGSLRLLKTPKAKSAIL